MRLRIRAEIWIIRWVCYGHSRHCVGKCREKVEGTLIYAGIAADEWLETCVGCTVCTLKNLTFNTMLQRVGLPARPFGGELTGKDIVQHEVH
jgi:hypothetical protein